MCYFVKNVMKFLRELCLRLFENIDFWLHIINSDQKMQVKIIYSLCVPILIQ